MDHFSFEEERHSSGGRSDRGDRTLRASTADREAMAQTLGRHHVAGRLDGEEFQARIDRCYAAKTLAELDELVTDLPPEQTQPSERQHPARGWHGPRRFLGFAPLVLGVILLSIVTGGHALWLLWPLATFAFVRFGPNGRRRCTERGARRDEERVSV